jgi:hypothetical protein
MIHKAKPNPDKLVVYSDNVYLVSDSMLLGPFDINPTPTRARQVAGMGIWDSLCEYMVVFRPR